MREDARWSPKLCGFDSRQNLEKKWKSKAFSAPACQWLKKNRQPLRGSRSVGPNTFGIFDAFPDEEGREAHLSGRVAAALKQKAADLFSQPPKIQKVDVLAAKLPR